MIAIVPKWKVTVAFTRAAPSRFVTIWISDHHISDVLRMVASIDFTEDTVLGPSKITIEAAEAVGR